MPPDLEGPSFIFFLISEAIIKNAVSTKVPVFADVSRKSMPSSSAYLQSGDRAVRRSVGELRSAAAENYAEVRGSCAELRGGGGVLLALRVRHLAELGVRVAEVHFVADEQLAHVVARVFVDLRQPALHVLEGVHVGDVVHDDDAVRAAVVGAADRAEALLARSVPNLQLDRLAV